MARLRIEGYAISHYDFFVAAREVPNPDEPGEILEELEITIQPIPFPKETKQREDIFERARRWAHESNKRRNG